MRILVFTLLCFVITSCTEKKVKIYQWRGENRDGIFNETNLLKQWPAEGPELVWSFDSLGNGYGSPTITEDKIFINGEIDSTSYLYAFNLQGDLLFKSPYGNEWAKYFPGSRSTPTVVDDLVYVCSGKGDIACLRSDNGEKIWCINMVKDLNGTNNMFGYSQSLLIDKDLLFCSPGGRDTNIVALNRFTGDLVWKCNALGQISAYCSPNIYEYAGKKILLTFSENALLGIDSQTGEFLWSHKMDTVGNVHSNTPLLVDGYIYYVTGDGNKGVKLKLSDDGSSISEVWRNESFDNIMGGFVKVGNQLIGTGHRKRYLKCLDMETGQITDTLKIGRGVTLYADEMIYVYDDRGEIKLVDPKEKLKEISSFKIDKGTKEHFAFPVIKNGVLYVRHGNALMAYNIKSSTLKSKI